MRFRKTIIAIGATGALFGAAWFSAPWAARKYIEDKYPGVTVESVKLTLDSAELRNVHIVKPYGVAHLERVTVHKDGSIEADGGQATVRVDLLLEHGQRESKGRKVIIRGIKVEAELAPSHAVIEGASYEAGKVCWDSVNFQLGQHKNYDPCTVLVCDSTDRALGEAGKGCATRDKIDASTLKVSARLPRSVPYLPSTDTLSLEGVTLWPKKPSVAVGKVSYGPIQALDVVIERDAPLTQLNLGKLVLSHPWLSTGPLTLDRSIIVEKLDNDSLIIAHVGNVPVQLDSESLTFSSVARCSDWAEAMPVELAKPLQDIRWDDGTLSFDIDLRAPKVKIKHTCKASCKSPILAALRKPFTYMAYNSKDERFVRTTGPGTRDWTYLPAVGRDMPTAVIAMEDPGFPSHHGYIGQAFENSIKDNLKTGKFLRGGSTITMQLAKNLWLYRDKTIPRKLQEVLFAIALENCYSKSDILELYLNVVEFGPDLYGIGPAARHYFKTSPTEIDAEQSFSLAMLLPKPRKGLPNKTRVRKLMETLARLKVIPESMLVREEEPLDATGWE